MEGIERDVPVTLDDGKLDNLQMKQNLSENLNSKFNFFNMVSSPDYLQFILDQLSDLPEISYHKMMGEYILYFHGKIVGGIYDNRLLLKPTEKAKNLVENLEMQIPYPGAKPMIYVDNVDNSEYLENLIKITYEELY